MGKFNSAEIISKTTENIVNQHNYLLKLLDEGYLVKGVLDGRKMKIVVDTKEGIAFYDDNDKIGGLAVINDKLTLTVNTIASAYDVTNYIDFDPAYLWGGQTFSAMRFWTDDAAATPADVQHLQIFGDASASGTETTTYINATSVSDADSLLDYSRILEIGAQIPFEVGDGESGYIRFTSDASANVGIVEMIANNSDGSDYFNVMTEYNEFSIADETSTLLSLTRSGGLIINGVSFSQFLLPLYDLTNIISNGDFDGTTDWSGGNATLSAASNTLSVTGNGGARSPYAYTSGSDQHVVGHKYYLRFNARVTNSSCESIRAYIGEQVTVQSSPTINKWYELSTVFDADAAANYVYVYHYYADAATADGKVMDVRYALAIDLTATFGAGNEPTATQMDDLLSGFDNSWFDGTFKSLVTIDSMLPDSSKTIWHSGNDGTGSGLDADLLDGKHASEFSASPLPNSTVSAAQLYTTTSSASGTVTAGSTVLFDSGSERTFSPNVQVSNYYVLMTGYGTTDSTYEMRFGLFNTSASSRDYNVRWRRLQTTL